MGKSTETGRRLAVGEDGRPLGQNRAWDASGWRVSFWGSETDGNAGYTTL